MLRSRSSLLSPLALALVVALNAFTAEAGNAVDRLVIIVHPCPYENSPQGADSPTHRYRVLEKQAHARWLEAVKKLPPTTFVVQIDMPWTTPGPDELHAACIAQLGAKRVCRIAGEYQYPDKVVPLLDYYERIHKKVMEQFAQHGLLFDPAHCEVDLWGQSFEGCAPGYASAVCRRLGTTQAFKFDYDNSVPDAPFLLNNVARWELVEIPGSDIVAYLFELKDGTSAALFQARKHDQWLDHRPIELRLNASRFWVSDKPGKTTIWPKENDSSTEPQVVRLVTSEERFIRSRKASNDELKEIVKNARVGAEPKE